MKEISEKDELFLQYVEKYPTIAQASEALGISRDYGYKLHQKLKPVILERASANLEVATLKAVGTVTGLLDADEDTVKGELRMKAATEILDRTGLTKHTSVEVKVESDNGIFILPAKTPVEAPESDSTDTDE